MGSTRIVGVAAAIAAACVLQACGEGFISTDESFTGDAARSGTGVGTPGSPADPSKPADPSNPSDPAGPSNPSDPSAPSSNLPGSPPVAATELPPDLPAGTVTPTITKARAADGSSDVCAAPCGVHFDATRTTWAGHSQDEVDLDLDYLWRFDDPSCSQDGDGVFAASGMSCNTQNGPVAAHLFEKPGTYTVELCVSDPGISTDCTTRDVVVSDPDVVWAGAATVCVSSSGTFTGCPSGAVHVTSSDFDETLEGHVEANKRVLFRRSETFASSTSFQFMHSDVRIHIGAYGTGAKPKITFGGTSNAVLTNGCEVETSPNPTDVRVTDLNIVASSGRSFFYARDRTKQVTLARNDLTGSWASSDVGQGQIFSTPSITQYCASNETLGLNEQMFMVENTHPFSSGLRNITMGGTKNALLGSVFGGTDEGQWGIEHTIRWRGMERNVISRNLWNGPSGGHQLKFHANLINKPAPIGGIQRYSVIEGNVYKGRNTGDVFSLGQQNGGQPGDGDGCLEIHEKLYVLKNYFSDDDGGGAQYFAELHGDKDRAEDNICQVRTRGGNDQFRCVAFDARCNPPSDPIEGEHRARSNLTYDSTVHNNYVDSVYFEQGRNNVAEHNIVWAPGSGRDAAVEGIETCAPGACIDNWSTDDFSEIPFVSDDPDSMDDYELR